MASQPSTQHTQFLRKASLVVGNDAEAIDLSNLQYKFSVKLADVTHPQYATFRIYNVREETRNRIKAKEYNRVVFQAGYQQGNYGVIFDGEVIQGSHGRESPVDTYIDLLCAVGYSPDQAGINTTLAAGSSATDGAKAAASAMGATLNDHTDAAAAKMPRGQVLYGMARDALTDAASGLDATWHHSATGVELVDAKSYIAGEVLVLNSATGMIGWPEQTQDGIRIRCLLNPRVAVATVVQLDNTSIQRAQIDPGVKFVNVLPNTDADGLYKVLYFEHSGDTRGQEWYTDIIGISIHPAADGGITSLYQRGLT